MVKLNNNQYSEIFHEESIRGEKVHWQLHWFLYSCVLLLGASVYFIQKIVVGKYAIALSLVNLLYNFALTPMIKKKKSIPWNGYVMVTLNALSLTTYNFLDGYFVSALAPVTTAAILLYPAIIFFSSLRMNKRLIIYATSLTILCMNGLYLFFYFRFDPELASRIVSSDPLGQVYRTVYIALTGLMIYQVPKGMLRILKTHERLAKESQEHKINAQKDALTGVYNRHYFDQRLDYCIEMAKMYNYKIALFFIDLDGFKLLNDTFGHDAGDFVLKSIASDISMTIRDSDMVARIGGDEFVVIMSPFTNEGKEDVYGKRIFENINKNRMFNSHELEVGASVGLAIYPDDANNADQLIKYADESMYKAKKEKKSRF